MHLKTRLSIFDFLYDFSFLFLKNLPLKILIYLVCFIVTSRLYTEVSGMWHPFYSICVFQCLLDVITLKFSKLVGTQLYK